MRENPLRAGMRQGRTPDPSLLVIFGATGDLTERKLMPALFRLFQAGRLPQNFAILGFARRDWGDEPFRGYMDETVRAYLGEDFDQPSWESFLQHLHFQPGGFGDAPAYEELARQVEQLSEQYHTNGNVLYYLATPPTWFGKIAAHLKEAGLVNREKGWQRLIVEKPFG
ncbi:MAG: glucose-6-phosphate dehydrogenase, partial [Ardenticatenaceae bacterium]